MHSLRFYQTSLKQQLCRIEILCSLVPLISCLYGCGGGASTNSAMDPLTSPQGVLSKATVLISQDAGQSNPIIEQTDTSLTLRGVRNDITAGKVILSTVGNGALRSAVSVATVGGNTVVQTTQASLPQAFDSLHVKLAPEFSQSQIGDIESAVPGLTFKWGTASSKSLHSRASVNNMLEISFKGLALNTGSGLTIDGNAGVSGSPEFDCDIDRAPGDTLPTVRYLNAGFQATMTGSVSVTSKYGGELSATKMWFDKDVAKPIRIGYFLFVPHIKITSSVSGKAAGSVKDTHTLSLTSSASVRYDRGVGWSTTKQLTPQMTAQESDVEAEYMIELKPVSIEFSFNLYGIAGPYAQFDAGVSADGKHDVQNGVEGIDAKVVAGSGGEVGFHVVTPDALSKLFQITLKPVSATFKMSETELFHQFFPLMGTASIMVGDNGLAPDDVFSVTVDGVNLGQSDKGGTGTFRVTSLKPGPHMMTITCLDDGANGADIGTLGISLANGFTFQDGSTTLSDLLSLNQTKDYTIIAPSDPTRAITALKLPKNTITIEHPNRR